MYSTQSSTWELCGGNILAQFSHFICQSGSDPCICRSGIFLSFLALGSWVHFILQWKGEYERRVLYLILCNEKSNKLNSGHDIMRTSVEETSKWKYPLSILNLQYVSQEKSMWHSHPHGNWSPRSVKSSLLYPTPRVKIDDLQQIFVCVLQVIDL